MLPPLRNFFEMSMYFEANNVGLITLETLDLIVLQKVIL